MDFEILEGLPSANSRPCTASDARASQLFGGNFGGNFKIRRSQNSQKQGVFLSNSIPPAPYNLTGAPRNIIKALRNQGFFVGLVSRTASALPRAAPGYAVRERGLGTCVNT
jgi:hypothetical protein